MIRSRSGKTIEVLNTDAEGRLVLADLLHYACELGADHIVDLATLTGACVVALGDGVSGVMGTDQKLVERILDAGSRSGRVPLAAAPGGRVPGRPEEPGGRHQEHHRQQWGGAITAGLFLKEFVKTESWAHVDLAGNWSTTERDYRTDGATGEGPRWLLDWING